MRLALIALATIIGTLATDVQLSGAQESFFNQRYCTQGTGDRHAGLDCAFNTWQQCWASRGTGRYCLENPGWREDKGSSTEGRARRRSGQRSGN
jgi:Protein of unknown function (DUF3551)